MGRTAVVAITGSCDPRKDRRSLPGDLSTSSQCTIVGTEKAVTSTGLVATLNGSRLTDDAPTGRPEPFDVVRTGAHSCVAVGGLAGSGDQISGVGGLSC